MTDTCSTATVMVTDAGDGRAHCGPAQELQPLTGIQQVRVMCGRLISPAPLVAPIGPTCPDCINAMAGSNVGTNPSSRFRRHLRAAVARWHS